jgi:hypothetical protein|tara:strand:+ start:617 stop:1444 length:828 start_codon:yes stop_codon:yes gene_type:complete
MISGMTALEIVPSDTIYIPKPAHLIVKGAQTAAATNKLVDSVLTPKIWQGTTDGAAAGELIDSSENFILNSTQAQAGGIVGSGKFVKKGNFIINVTDLSDHVVSGVKSPNASISDALLVAPAVGTAKAYDIYGEGFVSKYNVSIGDIVINRNTLKITTVSSVLNDQNVGLSDDIFLTANEDYEIYAANPPQGGGADPSQAQGCLLYVGTTTSIKQDVDQSAAGTDDPRYVNIKVKTVGGQDIIFNNFPVGEVLPVQIVQVYATPAIVNQRLIALW